MNAINEISRKNEKQNANDAPHIRLAALIRHNFPPHFPFLLAFHRNEPH